MNCPPRTSLMAIGLLTTSPLSSKVTPRVTPLKVRLLSMHALIWLPQLSGYNSNRINCLEELSKSFWESGG